MVPLAAGIMALGSIAGQALGNASTANQNRKSQEWQEKMYGMQRQHALDDWNMQNMYNSPTQQMARLKEAGLNPHLVYKNGATHEAGAIRATQSGQPQFQPNQWDIGSALGSYFTVQAQQAQTDNVKAATENLHKEGQLKDLAALQSVVNLDTSKLDFSTKKQVQQYQVSAAKEGVRKMQMETVTGYNRDNREWTQIDLASKMSEAQRQQIGATIRNIGQQIKQSQAQEALIYRQIRNIGVQEGFTQHQLHKLDQETRNLIKTGDILDFEKSAAEWGSKNPILNKVMGTIMEGAQDAIGERFKKPRVIVNRK